MKYAAWPSKEGGKSDGRSDRFLVAGVTLQNVIQIGRINNLSAGIEFNYDGKLGSKMQRDDMRGEPLQLGVLAGHEFILGRFLGSDSECTYISPEIILASSITGGDWHIGLTRIGLLALILKHTARKQTSQT